MAIVVPLELESDPEVAGAVEVRVLVEIDGESRRLVVDTGGARSGLAADAFARALAPAPSAPIVGRGVFGDVAPAPRVRAESMRIGDLRVPHPVFDLEESPRAPSILGLDVLAAHRLAFRFATATLEFDGEADVVARHPLTRSSRGHPYVDVIWGSVRAEAIWDSGASVSVVDRAFAARHGELFTSAGAASGVDARGAEAEAHLVTMAGLTVGGRRFAPSIAAVVDIAGLGQPGDPTFEMILGMPVVGRADWVLDLVEGWWGYLAGGPPGGGLAGLA